MGSLLKLLVVLMISWFLYSYGIQQKNPKKAEARYQDSQAVFPADNNDREYSGLDDCQRYISADRIQDCLETKIKRATEKRSP